MSPTDRQTNFENASFKIRKNIKEKNVDEMKNIFCTVCIFLIKDLTLRKSSENKFK